MKKTYVFDDIEVIYLGDYDCLLSR
jgi:hypothetical protein